MSSESNTDPFSLLASGSAVERQRGARALVGNASQADLHRLQELRFHEVDLFVQQVLDKAIRSIDGMGASFGDSDGWMNLSTAQLTDDIRAEAIQYVTKVMLHELRPLVGDAYLATRELMSEQFQGSAPHRAVLRIQEFLATMHRLHDAASPPVIIQFDLVNLLSGEIESFRSGELSVLLSRSDSLVVLGDPALLSLAVQNCLRNAMEASIGTEKPIVVNCGTNQSDTWVAILDEGLGLPDGGDKVLEPGNSTKSKDDHFGMGLPIAQRAMRSFGGSIDLIRREHGGTACRLSWPAQTEAL